MQTDGAATPEVGSIPSANGASPWERALLDHLNDHILQERRLLEEYARTGQTTQSRALAYLISLLVDDERRHHRLFTQLAQSLRSSAALTDESPEVPRMDFDKEGRSEVLEVTKRLLGREEDDRRELKRLHRELKLVKDTTLWDLLVVLMERDTEKHIAMLEFARKHATRHG